MISPKTKHWLMRFNGDVELAIEQREVYLAALSYDNEPGEPDCDLVYNELCSLMTQQSQ